MRTKGLNLKKLVQYLAYNKCLRHVHQGKEVACESHHALVDLESWPRGGIENEWSFCFQGNVPHN